MDRHPYRLPSAEARLDAPLPGRRSLRARTAETVERVLEAALDEVRAVGYEELTVRAVASRAGVSPATAYTYFGSKQHLVAELFARCFGAVPDSEVSGGPASRLAAAMRDVADFLAGEPELSAAATVALLDSDPDVARLRLSIGADMMGRFVRALGDDAERESLELAELAFNGAMLEAGMGLMTYEEMGDRLDRLAPHIVGGDR
jgi:AcrR family transcriptional regulator